jgi:hypothetical protein
MRSLLRFSVFLLLVPVRSGSDQQPLDPQGIEEKFETVAKASITREAPVR